MLEVNLPYLKTCFFLKGIWFVEPFSIPLLNFISYPFDKKGKLICDFLNVKFARNSYLKKCVVRAGFYGEDFFRSDIKIKDSIKFFENDILLNSFFSHFNIEYSIFEKSFNNSLNQEEQAALSLLPLFLKQGFIWCVFLRDDILSTKLIKQIEYVFVSKILNSNSIIFYTTETKKALNFEHESVFTFNA